MAIYNSHDDAWQVSVDDRLQGWDIQVSFWNGEDFEIRYEAYVLAESLHEGITDAMTISGIDWELADAWAADWGIYPPSEDDLDEIIDSLSVRYQN